MGMHGLVHRILQEIGIEPQRFALQWASAAEAPRFVQLITDFTSSVRELGPLGAKEGLAADECQSRLQAALDLVSDKKLRMGYGNVTKALRKEGSKVTEALIAQVIDDKLTKTISALRGS